jgi:hypothetical protein
MEENRMVLAFRTSTYARSIYLFGTSSFSLIPEEYHTPVKKHAGETYTQTDLASALENGWITQEEFDETCQYSTAKFV